MATGDPSVMGLDERLRSALRIAVVGPGGAGKTTLATQLGSLLDLPVVHLDRYYYERGWQGLNRMSWEVLQSELIAADRWILEGNYAAPIEPRLRAADVILFLDLPAHVCARRTTARWWLLRRTQSVDLPPGMRHRIDWRAIWFAIRARRLPAPTSLAALERQSPGRVMCLRTPTEVQLVLAELKRSRSGAD